MHNVAEAVDRTFIASLGTTRTAKFIAEFDWSRTPLGAMGQWSGPLRTAVSMVSRSPVAMVLLWGAEGIMIYNESYAATAGEKHPGAIGSSVLEVWPDVANFSAGNMNRVLTGVSVSYLNERIDITRDGKTQTAWFDVDFSPVSINTASPSPPWSFWSISRRGWRWRSATRRSAGASSRCSNVRRPSWPSSKVQTTASTWPTPTSRGWSAIARCRANPLRRRSVRRARKPSPVFSTRSTAPGKPPPAQGRSTDVQARRGGPVAERYIDFSYQPIRSDTGQVTGVFVQGLDVSDRVVAEAALLESDGCNRQIIDSATDYAIVAFDLQGLVTRWNEGASRILGWTEGEMLGHDGSCFFSFDDRAAGRLQLG